MVQFHSGCNSGKYFSKALEEEELSLFSHLGQVTRVPDMDNATPTFAMQEFLVQSRDTSLPNSLHNGQGLMGIPEVIEQARGAGGGECPTTTRQLN